MSVNESRKLRAVITDGHAMNPGDLSWAPLEEMFDELTVYEYSAPEQLAERIRGHEVVFNNKCGITREVIEACPELEYISEMATGYNDVDVEAARDHGIAVTNIPAYSTDAVAQHTIALILSVANQIESRSQAVHRGEWEKCKQFCYWDNPPMLLAGKSLGIVGYGAIGSQVAKIADALGMKVNIYSRDKEAAIASDFVSFHCPLTEDNAKMVDEQFISKMKKSAYIINTARGGLIDEEALASALADGRIAGAALDVLSEEPPKDGNPLLDAPNCVITPHIAWAPLETRRGAIEILVDNLRSYLAGERLNRVD